MFKLIRPSSILLGFKNYVKPSLVTRSKPFLQNQFILRRSTSQIRYNGIQWDKLYKPALFTVGFCISTTILVPPLFKYTPLSVFKMNPNLMIYSIIGINCFICYLWRQPKYVNFLTKYFLLVKHQVASQWSLIGSAFSHQSISHLGFNMLMLFSFGPTICSLIGVSNFVVAYLNSAAISSFFSILIPTILKRNLFVGSLGASGSLFSLFGILAYLLPKTPIAVFFVPVPGGAWIFFLISIIANIGGLVLRRGSFEFSGHLGGSLAGLLYGWYYKQNYDRISRQRRRATYF
ncbi:rhomboid-domain-containing protein [Hyphopichia burtonii NRRL Y-1933]|uniref:Rhomboid-domain-containing protein n=1 Tax=Hyphopichia burtonii NRRL Y-1933 TaxID=984485 RepID=A0A1E4RT85_9ASCO|nr:rhomboid-domain-containing protein [Hyphopichia burtonii NRRL Y-1933]ODV70487.1 rhomboid-domain-containing protein [Hyphopichia burtonii NRRL Y-1933]